MVDNINVKGDIYISIERVKENASKYKTTFINELNRVIIHGVLHLIGFNDKTKKEKQKMIQKENESLKLLDIICYKPKHF